MRVLFVTWPFTGHYHPMAPLGWGLRAAGHEVLVASNPSFASAITRAGLTALPAGPEFDVGAEVRAEYLAGRWTAPDAWSPEAKLRRRRELNGLLAPRHSAAAMADDVVSFARSWRPDLVVFEPMAFAGPLVAGVLGVPAVRQLWTADFTAGLDQLERRLLGPLFARFGVGEIGVLGDLTLDPCPPRLQIADGKPRQPVRYIPYNGPAVLPGWLVDPPPRRRVCVTWGTSLTRMGGAERMAHVPGVVRALARFDVEVVVAVLDSQRGLFADMPENARSLGPVPLHLLLPSCDLIVHQGGGGTLMTAMICGLPQLIVPSIPDQAFNARQVEATGAGRYVPGGEDVTVAEVAAAAALLLDDPAYRDASRQLRAEAVAMPTPADIVPALERLAGSRARTRDAKRSLAAWPGGMSWARRRSGEGSPEASQGRGPDRDCGMAD
jgi:UDP:flavonoid glycosyltransferase YjiC (YdhE family)